MPVRPESVLARTSALTARERALIAGKGDAAMNAGAQLGALLDATAALDRAGIAHAVIGGLAVGIRAGVPRATVDVDLAVQSSVPPERVTQVLVAAGFEARGRFAHSANFRHGSGEPVQLAVDPSFDVMIERAEPVDVGGFPLRVVSKPDLIAMKERAARDPARRRSKALRDLADIELLRGDVPEEDEGW
jgi:hypothetical protein